jgi:hypothetical protein
VFKRAGGNIAALTCKFQTMLLGEENGFGNILRSSWIDDNTLKLKVRVMAALSTENWLADNEDLDTCHVVGDLSIPNNQPTVAQ